MSKALKSAAKVFAVTFLIVATAGAIAPSLFGLTVGGGAVAAYAASVAAMSSIGTLVGGLLSKGISSTAADNFGTKVASRSGVAPRQIVYGRCRVGGTITHIETTGTDNYKLQMVVVIAGHEIDALEEVLVNDEVLTTTTVSGFEVVTNSKFTNTDNENNFGSGRLMRYVFVDGSQTAANSTVIGACSLNSNDKFIGCAYVYIEMVFDSEAFGGGVPPLAFVVRGKKVFDPRDSSTAWSENPALCVRDYVTNTTYGLKATSSEVNDTTNLGGFQSAANTCDTSGTVATATTNGSTSSSVNVTLNAQPTNTLIDVGHVVTGTGISGTVTVTRRLQNIITLSSAQSIGNGVTLTFSEGAYTANGISNMSASGQSVIEGLLSSCAGKLSYIDGKFVMFAGASVTPDMTITDDNLLAPVTITTKQSSGESYNTVKAVYVDANTNYVATDSPVFTNSTFLSADTPSGESSANYRKTLEIQLPFTDTSSMAQRLQKTALLHHRKEVTLSVLCNIGYMQLQPFDWVYLTNERLGYTNKTFEVLSTNLEVIGDADAPVLATALALKEIDASVYSFAQSDYTNPVDEGTSVATGSFSVTAPTSFAVANPVVVVEQATTNISMNTSWTNNPSDEIQGTEIKYGTSSGTYTESQIVGKGVTSLKITNLLQNQTYYFAARHFSGNNVFSDLTSEVSKASGATTTAPSVPTNLDASDGSPLAVKVSWTNPNNSDLSSVKIYATTSNSAPTNETTLKATVAGEPNAISTISFGEQDGLVAGTTYYFWAKAVNRTGLTSAFTSSNSGNFTKVEAPDINLPDFSGYFHKEGNTTTALTSSQFNTEYGRTPLNDDILVMVNTSSSPKTSKAYKWNGSAFVEINNFTTGDLVVDGTIAGDKIIAGDISADRVDTSFVSTLNLLTTSATVTNNITIGSGNNVFKAETGVGIQLGHATFGSAPFRVTEGGALTATNATITGEVNATSGTFNGSIAIGSGNSIFKADSNGIYLGNATFGSAPFRVTPAGALTATGVTINGDLTLTNIDGTTVTYNGGNLVVGTIGSANLGATAIFPATLRYERSNATTAPSDSEFNTAFGRNPKANDIVVVARTDTNAQVAYKHDGSSFSAISNYIDGDLIVDGSITTDQIAANTIVANNIASGTITGDRIDVDTLNVKSFDNVSSTIVSHVTAGTKFPLARDGMSYVQRTGTYTGSNAAFVGITITEVRDNAGYVAIFSGVLGNVSGGRVQYSLDNSTWVNANGNTNIYWNAGTYRGYTYVYTGQITTLSESQDTVYWRVYFSGLYNHTQLSLNVMMDNTR